MTDSRAAVGFDRLPWLADEEERPSRPERVSRRLRTDLAGWIVAGVLLVAGGSYWLGQRSALEPSGAPISRPRTAQSTTIPLPEPEIVEPQVQPDRVPQVEPVRAPTVSVPPPTRRSVPPSAPRRAVAAKPTALSEVEQAQQGKSAEKPATVAPRATPAADKPLALWPARISKGASGRLVQIGAFGTRQQAKLGWRRMTRAYPAVGRLPATVVSARNSRGRYFYRFQIGTTSQAHSEVLCQRMEHIRFSCAVVGLPGAKKAVER
jgi:hypothetical protein